MTESAKQTCELIDLMAEKFEGFAQCRIAWPNGTLFMLMTYGDADRVAEWLEFNIPGKCAETFRKTAVGAYHAIENHFATADDALDKAKTAEDRAFAMCDLDFEEMTDIATDAASYLRQLSTMILERSGEGPPPEQAQAEGEWSAPMSKSEMARRIMRDKDARSRKVEALLKRHGLEHIKGKQYRVRLDTMDALTRRKLEEPL